MPMPPADNEHLHLLRDSAERMAAAQSVPDAGPWVVLAVVPHIGGQWGVPQMGSHMRYVMRRYATAEEAVANSVAMPAAKSYGG